MCWAQRAGIMRCFVLLAYIHTHIHAYTHTGDGEPSTWGRASSVIKSSLPKRIAEAASNKPTLMHLLISFCSSGMMP
jgi:hypothetical protein